MQNKVLSKLGQICHAAKGEPKKSQVAYLHSVVKAWSRGLWIQVLSGEFYMTHAACMEPLAAACDPRPSLGRSFQIP